MGIKKNKGGDIPTTILVVMVIAICCLALYTFSKTSSNVRGSFVGIGLMEKLNSQIENRTFNGESPNGLYLEKRGTTGILWGKKEFLLFSVEYKVPNTSD